MSERVVHCWAQDEENTATCLLLDEHDGPHEFTPDADILVSFPSEETTSEP